MGSTDGSSPSKKRRKDEQSPSKAAAGCSSSFAKRRMVDVGVVSSYGPSSMSSMMMSKSRSSSSSYETFFAEYCDIPYTLRTLLIEESGYITRKGFDSLTFPDTTPWHRPARNVHVLPASVTVYQVLQQYQKKKERSLSKSAGGGGVVERHKLRQVRKFAEGLSSLFDDCLPKILLYPEERPQYEAMQQNEDLKLKRPCEIYGSTYLLRLMVRLPILLRAEPPQEMISMGPMIADLIVLLQKNRQACFTTKYREPRYDELLPFEKKLANDYQTAAASSQMDDVASTTYNDDRSIMSES